ncbi:MULTISPECIES: PAS domain-containing protein [Methylococcus]|uniref:PAS domain-containing protein n=1 Tax=Methylococcus capsulatus TaxID=414 RepID=A0ABZ2F460_METCP|nr:MULTISPECIES: PAS domain-containing protein [Methylococcus]
MNRRGEEDRGYGTNHGFEGLTGLPPPRVLLRLGSGVALAARDLRSGHRPAYYAISIALLYFAKRRRDVVFRGMFLLFGLFILACASTHIIGAWTVWYPAYWTDGAVKAITAVVSLGTAIMVWPLMPQALQIPSPRQLLELNQNLASEVAERKQAEERLRMLIDAEPECVKTIGADGALLDINRAGLRMIEAESIEQVRGKPVSSLVVPPDRERFETFNRRVLAGESGTLEFQIIGLKGGRRWMETHAVPFAGRPGAPPRGAGSHA